MNDFKKRIIIYDIEVTKHTFIYGDYDLLENKYNIFVISHFRDDRTLFKQHILNLIRSDSFQVGFNNLDYDYPMIHWFISEFDLKKWEKMSVSEILERMMRKNRVLIPDKKKKRSNKFGKNYNVISNPYINQIDLYKINHWDNPSRRTSLKKAEINMRFPNVEDFDWSRLDNEPYTKKLEQKLIDYNINDINATKELYHLTRGQLDKVTVDFPGITRWYSNDKIASRLRTSKKYHIDAINMSDVKIGNELNKLGYLKHSGRIWRQIKNKKSPRSIILIKELIPSYIREYFKDKELLKILDILDDSIIDVNKPKFEHEFIYKGLKLTFALGGLHSVSKEEIVECTDDEYFDERDVASEYPRAIITLKAFPAHLGPEWLYMIENTYNERTHLKSKPHKTISEKGDIDDKKLQLNAGGYGKLGEKWNWQYDPLQKYKVTIKCQLDLLLYMQMLTSNIDSIKLDAANTDSVNIIYKKEELQKVNDISEEWTKITGALLERTKYKKVIRKDINNYIAIKEGNSVKYKGVFEMEKELHKNHSFYIINKALSNYFVKGIPVIKTIKDNNNSIYDYLGTIRVQGTKSGTWTLYHTYLKDGNVIKDKIQKINRYYVTSNPNSQIIKELDQNPDKWSYIESGYNVMPINKIKDDNIMNYDVNYNYYIAKTMKIINQIEGQKKLWY